MVLIERNREFVSCPQSNRVLSGVVGLDSLTRGYTQLSARWGVKLVQAEVAAIDAAAARSGWPTANPSATTG